MIARPPYSAPVPLNPRHHLATFNCGDDGMDSWLRDHALGNEGRVSRTYVIADAGDTVIAYYALATGRIDLHEMPKRLKHDMPPFVPVIVLGRLAVDRDHSNLGLGRGLLREAIQRTLSVSETVGIRALVVHAINDNAEKFYLQYGFRPSPTVGRSLILPIETIRLALGAT